MMKRLTLVGAAVGALVALGSDSAAVAAEPNTLTEAEKADGWELLWDGKTTKGWTGVKSRCKAFPDHGWKIADGVLSVVPRKALGPDGKEIVLTDAEAQLGGGGDIVSDRVFGDFEFKTDFRLWPGANSGVKYYYDVEINKDPSNGYGTSTEFQLLDTTGRRERPAADHLTGSLYALKAADASGSYRPGEWNTLRIVAKGAHVEHWLNGVKLIEYERGSDDFRARVARSKYATWGGKEGVAWGEAPRGRILLQDHSCQVSFRNIKVKAPK